MIAGGGGGGGKMKHYSNVVDKPLSKARQEVGHQI